jgi:hypothetical protein
VVVNCLVSLVWNIVPGLVWLGFPTNVIFTVDWDIPLYPIQDGLGWSGLIWSGLIWSGLVWQVALRVFIEIDADANPTTMMKMQYSAMIYGMGMIQASIFNLISTTVFFM